MKRYEFIFWLHNVCLIFFECFQHFVGGRWPCRSSLTKCNERWLLQELIGKHSFWSILVWKRYCIKVEIIRIFFGDTIFPKLIDFGDILGI